MCKTFYRYFLITGTSFGLCSGLYLLCLTKWLWPYPIHDYTAGGWDWRDVPLYSGLIGFIIFSPGLLIVIRAKPKELQYYAVFLIIPFLVTLICLILQLSQKTDLFDPTDWYLFGVALGLLAIIINLFLFVNEIKTYGNHNQLIQTSKLKEEEAV
ncbi:unnamed protein product [Oppiella nova]|uniref:Uncharacterized protein n=1 Tax=Oppiella nova TaxID=334625 RepID=A0A7R9LLB0_9ACAR|nr:unnamed protein product [Oppiella nova]CAG2164776.1 unnamed protein product [Oppiella nova]